jgi:hypothetical protein
MIFFAVAAPTPGSDSRSLSEAEFRSIFAPLAVDVVVLLLALDVD